MIHANSITYRDIVFFRGISGCMLAGDFENHELTFLSTEIHLKVVQMLLDEMSNDMATLVQLTQSSHAKVKFS